MTVGFVMIIILEKFIHCYEKPILVLMDLKECKLFHKFYRTLRKSTFKQELLYSYIQLLKSDFLVKKFSDIKVRFEMGNSFERKYF